VSRKRKVGRVSPLRAAPTNTQHGARGATGPTYTLRENAVPYRVGVDASPSRLEGQGRSDAPPLTFIDLFCGCGGFTLGMLRAGFRCLAAIDFNHEAVETLRSNLSRSRGDETLTVAQALERDLTSFHPEELAQVIGAHQVDVIVGGPPCQGYSNVRRVDGSNHGARLKADARRHLYREFLGYVNFFQPRLFVMENVLGIRTAAGGEYFTRVQNEARALGYRVHAQVEDAWELGVPQKRRRQLIIGVQKNLPGYFLPELKPAPRAEPRTWLGAAIGDLPILRAGGGEDERDYDFDRREKHLRDGGNTAANYLFSVLEVDLTERLTNHVARPHSERDLRDFARLHEGQNSATAIRDGVKFEFPYDKSTFKDRYTRQSRWKPCSTIVAHLSKDGLMFIHPTQNRSLTPREAARIQSFPDWFRFPKARTQSFRLIGNAVPPLIAEAVGLAVKSFLAACAGSSRGNDAHSQIRNSQSLLTSAATRQEAARELERIAQLDRRALRALSTSEFLRGWHALLFLFPGLHPDNALDHGDDIEVVNDAQLPLPGLEKVLARRHTRSGWPVALELIGREAWRRYDSGELNDDQLYCASAQRAGLLHAIKT
jgi:DNA (cytosine-5)-methyltransferase 1